MKLEDLKAKYATITGSPLWGKDHEEVAAEYVRRGWEQNSVGKYPTPYGMSPVVYHFTTRNGRDVIWIPSYGNEHGKDIVLSQSQNKVLWILWQAGVKILLIGGTSGITDWREENYQILPGDIVLPWSYRTSIYHRGLPRTPFETAWPMVDATMGDPFCTDLAKQIAKVAQKHVDNGSVRKLHTTDDVLVALIPPEGITFESTFDIWMWEFITEGISKKHGKQVVSLHGDCFQPVAARILGIHEAYYHMVANYAQGLSDDSIQKTLHGLYLNNFPQVAMDMEFELLETMELHDKCVCESSVVVAPEVFNLSMTGDE